MKKSAIGVSLLGAAALVTTAFAPLDGYAGLGSGLGQTVDVVMLEAGLTSSNVEYKGTIPVDSPGIGGAVRTHGVTEQKLFYITGAKGLSIYDVSNPELPSLVGLLALPHAQNEDVSVSDDGTRVIISADGRIAVPVQPQSVGIYVIDTTDPTDPKEIARTPLLSDSNHTTECADPKCEWLYASSNAGIYDATRADEGVLTRVEGRNWNEYTTVNEEGKEVTATAGGRHALNLDEAGLVISDSNPRLVLDPRPHIGRDGKTYGYDNPEVLAVGWRNDSANPALQHNNFRPQATEWVARDASDPADAYVSPIPDSRTNAPYPEIEALAPGSLRAGEILIGNSETNINATCEGAGALSTWDLRDYDKGRSPVQLHHFDPVKGTYLDGNPTANGLGCSGHWFTHRVDADDPTTAYVTASWYEHGVRFFDVSLDTGNIQEIGWFQPVATEAGAAIWIDDEYVYSADYARGFDILKFNEDGERPSEADRVASWAANLGKVGEMAQAERYFCRLAFTKD